VQEKHENDTALPKDFDIEAVPAASDEEQDILHLGPVNTWNRGTLNKWKEEEHKEKAKARPYISIIVISVWAVCISVSVFKALITGNFLLIIPPALISVPLYIILRFYFTSG
jgi:hypothetical protein